MIRRPGRTAKVGPREVLAIREDYATGKFSQPDLARKYGIGPAQIGKIVRGEAWTEITAGNPVTTEGEAQLRMLTTPMPSEEEIQASLDRLQRLMAQEQQESTVPPQYQRPQDLGAALGELIKQAGENRAQSGPAPQPVPMRQVPVDSGKIDADRLLETLKDEHARDVENVSPATPE